MLVVRNRAVEKNLPLPFRQLDIYTLAIASPDTPNGDVHQVAGAGSRAAAATIDIVLQAVIGGLFYSWFIHGSEVLQGELSHPVAALGLAFEWHIVYMMLFESFTGGLTPGKKALGLRVRSLPEAGRCRPLQAVLRNVLRVLDFLPLVYLAGWISSAAGGTQQRLGDRVAKTVVLYDKPLSRQLQRSRVPASFFSTSEDGYLLEAWEARRDAIDPGLEKKLARDLALYLHARYGDAGGEAMQAYEAEDYRTYLDHLLYEERAQSKSIE